jgi:hypothetical protein
VVIRRATQSNACYLAGNEVNTMSETIGPAVMLTLLMVLIVWGISLLA